MTNPDRERFQRSGVLVAVSVLSLLAMLFAPALRDEVAVPAPLAVLDTSYLLGAGDAVRISVLDGATQTLETRIGTTGWISHPALGSVKIGGMTIGAAEARIAAGLTGSILLGLPRVTVLVIEVVRGAASESGRSGPRSDAPVRAAEPARRLERFDPISFPRERRP